MGWFDDEEKVYVASSIYNLAGDQNERSIFVRDVVATSILTDSPNSLGHDLTKAYLGGPGNNLRAFHRWALNNYTDGLPTARVDGITEVAETAVRTAIREELSLGSNQVVSLKSAVIDEGDFTYWAEDWVYRNRPGTTDENWTADNNTVTSKIVITIAGNPAEVVEIPYPAEYVWSQVKTSPARRLVFGRYTIITTTYAGSRPVVTESDLALFVYKIGDGRVALDNQIKASTPVPEFLPVLPIRISNHPISDLPEYDDVAAAYKKLTGGKLDSLLETIEDNDDIDDVDYCFLVQGVPINTGSQAGIAYIYEFMKMLMPLQQSDYSTFKQWHDSRVEYVKAYQEWLLRVAANYDSTPFREPQSYKRPESTRFEIRSDSTGPNKHFRVYIKWDFMRETLHVGNAMRDMGYTGGTKLKKGQYHLRKGTSYPNWVYHFGAERFLTEYIPTVYLYHQYGDRRYSRIEVCNLVHQNYVYEDKKVGTTAIDGFFDTDESSFVFPMHYPTLKKIGMVKGTQLATECSILVFNSKETVVQKWYEKGVFKIIIAIAAVALSMVTAGASLGAAVGILGANATVGLALGASAATAAIVGAAANAITAAIVATLLNKGAVALFGEKIGAIVGTIATFIAFTYATSYASTGSFNVDWGKLMRVDNLLKITDSVTGAYNKWLAADTAEIFAEMERLREEGSEKLEELQERAAEILGMTSIDFDPILLTDLNSPLDESSESFLNRTTLTGSEIAELTHGMIENFADLSLALPYTA